MRHSILLSWSIAAMLVSPLAAQHPPGEQGSRNMKLQSHIPLAGGFHVGDIEIEQELSRPYVYVSRVFQPSGFQIISTNDPARSQVIYTWGIESPELHQGLGGTSPIYFKSKGRYYLTVAFQFAATGPDGDLGAIVWDVTGLPDTTKIREVARIRAKDAPGGFHESFGYKHSDGRALLVTTSNGPYARVYDIDRVVAGDSGLIAKIPIVENSTASLPTWLKAALPGYHDFYIGYDPVTKRDLFYGGGGGGFYVYDITKLNEIKLVTTVTGMSGVSFGHTFTPDPTGRYAVMETEYQYAPLRIVDLKPGPDSGGAVRNISRPIGAWTADWKNLAHNHEVRWPYVFVSSYEDGLYVFNMMDPTNPYTVGYYDTFDGPHGKGLGAGASPLGDIFNGAFGVDVRNADGLIVISDETGFWSFKMEGFDGWNGHQWGLPDVSSAQDWDRGPDGAPKPQKVS